MRRIIILWDAQMVQWLQIVLQDAETDSRIHQSMDETPEVSGITFTYQTIRMSDQYEKK